MTRERTRRKSYRITGRSLRSGLLFSMLAGGAMGLCAGILETVQGSLSISSRFLLSLPILILFPIAWCLLWVPVEKPATKGPDDLLA